MAKALAQALAVGAAGPDHRRVPHREAAGRPGAGGLQPERLGPHARLRLLGAAAAARAGVRAGDVARGGARLPHRGLPHGQHARPRSPATAICGSRCWRGPAASASSACCEPAARAALRADGGAARGRDPERPGLAVRAQVGRVPLPRLPRRRPHRAAVEERPAAGPLLPGGGRAPARAARPRLRARRRDRHPARRPPVLRRPPPAHPPGREPDRAPLAGAPGGAHRLRPAGGRDGQGAGRRCRSGSAGGAWRRFAAKALAGRDDIRLSPATRGRGARRAPGSTWRAARSTASWPSGSTCRTRPASAPACRR